METKAASLLKEQTRYETAKSDFETEIKRLQEENQNLKRSLEQVSNTASI